MQRGTPDLVLLDVETPGIDGPAVLKKLHSMHESLPVVMISGHGKPTQGPRQSQKS
jgi:DNA-binding NtrC family response regulator